MRVSTAGMHVRAIQDMLTRQAQLSRTQSEIATGLRIQSPADDPAGAVRLLDLERSLANSTQYSRNADMAQNRLSLEEQALANVTSSLQRVHELAIQANSATLDDSTRKLLASELRTRLQELMDVGNRQDAEGNYLFSGFSSGTKPFARAGSGSVAYAGDENRRLVQIGPSQRVADGHAGAEVFMRVPEGNGTFVTSVAATNTGGGQIDGGTVVNAAAWVRDDYQIRFTSATAWEAVDSSANVVATGTFAPGSAVQFRGVSVGIAGQPATGDVFNVQASGTEDIFSSLDRMLATVTRTVSTTADRARYASDMGGSIQQISQAIDHVLAVRAEVGARLSGIDSTRDAQSAIDVEAQRVLVETRDVDYAEAVSRMNREYTGLQAAQAAYARFAQLSLFDYL